MKGHPVSDVLFSKKDDNVPSILTTLLAFLHVLHIYINLVGILILSYISLVHLYVSINKYCKL